MSEPGNPDEIGFVTLHFVDLPISSLNRRLQAYVVLQDGGTSSHLQGDCQPIILQNPINLNWGEGLYVDSRKFAKLKNKSIAEDSEILDHYFLCAAGYEMTKS